MIRNSCTTHNKQYTVCKCRYINHYSFNWKYYDIDKL